MKKTPFYPKWHCRQQFETKSAQPRYAGPVPGVHEIDQQAMALQPQTYVTRGQAHKFFPVLVDKVGREQPRHAAKLTRDAAKKGDDPALRCQRRLGAPEGNPGAQGSFDIGTSGRNDFLPVRAAETSGQTPCVALGGGAKPNHRRLRYQG